MNKSAIINFNKNSVLSFFRENKTVIMLTASFVIGIIIGCISFSKSSVAANIAGELFDSFISARQGRGFVKIFAFSLKNRFLLLLLYFLCGASLMGVVFTPLLKISLGFGYGILCSYACNAHALKGIAFNALIIIPAATIFIIALILAAGKSLKFSFEFVKLTFPNSRPANLFMIFKEYCGFYLIYLATAIAASVIDALLSKALISYFEFL